MARPMAPAMTGVIMIVTLTLALASIGHVWALSPHVGLCYGRLGDNLPPPESVASLLKSNQVRKVHIYDTDFQVLKAFRNVRGIQMTVTLENQLIPKVAQSVANAHTWVRQKILPFSDIITTISVGNEILTSAPQFSDQLFPAMQNIYVALNKVGLTRKIAVSTTHAFNVVEGFPPSAGHFTADVRDNMILVLSFLESTGAPFLVNIYPYFARVGDPVHVSLEYATFQPIADSDAVTDPGTGLVYRNIFHAQVDTVLAALNGAGFPNLRVVVSETGWPSGGDGDMGAATVENAMTFNNNLVALAAGGTPRRPEPLETFIFSVFNEDEKPGAATEQHWGIFNPDESPVYNFRFDTP